MPSAKVAVVCGLSAVALSACGTTVKPAAGTISPTATTIGHAQIDDPRTKHVACIRAHNVPATDIGRTWVQIGPGTSGPIINFAPTSGAAQADQIRGQVTGAEVIGAALLYPRSAPDSLLSVVEGCLTSGVKG